MVLTQAALKHDAEKQLRSSGVDVVTWEQLRDIAQGLTLSLSPTKPSRM